MSNHYKQECRQLPSDMTLLQLASAVALADNGPDHDRYTREIVRRQKMLDAAEGLALAIKDHDNVPKDVLAWAADYWAASR